GEVHQQRCERPHFDPLAAAVFEMAHLVAHDLDPLVGRKQRALRVIAGDADDQPVDDIQRAPDDVAMAVGDRIEGAGIDPDALLHLSSHHFGAGASAGSSLSLSPLPSATSGSRATETTRSPSPNLKMTT